MRSVRLEAGVEKNELHLKYELTFVVLHIGETFGDTSVQILSTETALVLFLKRTKNSSKSHQCFYSTLHHI